MKKLVILLGSIVMLFLLGTDDTYVAENQLATSITTLARTITKQFGVEEAKVAAVDGDQIYINVGKKHFVRAGVTYEIIADGKPFNDPANKGKLGVLETHVADVKILTVRENFSIGQIINKMPGSGANPIQVGQRAILRTSKITIAVVQFEYLNSKDKTTPRVAQELMMNELIKTGRFIVAEAATTDQVVRQLLNTNTPGTTPASPDTIGTVQFTRNLGKMLGVNYVMYGQLTDLPGFLEIQCRIHDARTGVGVAAGNLQIVPPVSTPAQ